jgi:hypothetical protein
LRRLIATEQQPARISGLSARPTHLWCSSARPRLPAGSVPAPGSGQPITREPGVATSVGPARCGGATGASAVRRTKRPASPAGRLASGCRPATRWPLRPRCRGTHPPTGAGRRAAKPVPGQNQSRTGSPASLCSRATCGR